MKIDESRGARLARAKTVKSAHIGGELDDEFPNPGFFGVREFGIEQIAARLHGRHRGFDRLDAALLLRGPLHEVVVAGDAGDPRAEALAATVHGLLPPFAVLARVPAAGPAAETAALLPPTEGKAASGGAPAAFVCRFGACGRPTDDPAELRRQVLEGWSG